MDHLLEQLRILYREVDERAAELVKIHLSRLNCGKGCCECCLDDLTVFRIEAENICREYTDLLQDDLPHTTGMCAFLDVEGSCRIYPDRPYVCRTQGLPIRWFEELPDSQYVEYRDICPLNEKGPAPETMNEDECWSVGPYESRLARLQTELDSGRLTRVRLRDLFRGG